MNGLLLAGKISKTHGISGEVIIRFHPGVQPEDIIGPVFLNIEGIQVPFFVESSVMRTDKEWVLVFEEYNTLNQVEPLVGLEVYMNQDQLHKTDELVLSMLKGYEVIEKQKGSIGKIIDIIEGRQHLLVVDYHGKEVLIPYVDEFILDMNDSSKTMIVSLPEGLLELNQ